MSCIIPLILSPPGVLYPSAATIASRMRAQYTDINSIKRAFSKIDTNGDGMVSKDEVAACGSFNDQEIDALFLLGDMMLMMMMMMTMMMFR